MRREEVLLDAKRLQGELAALLQGALDEEDAKGEVLLVVGHLWEVVMMVRVMKVMFLWF